MVGFEGGSLRATTELSQSCFQVVSKFSQMDEEQWLVLGVVV